MEHLCPQCGAQTPAGAKFCMECGYNLKGSAEKPTIDYSPTQSYTPNYLADKILTSHRIIEGERKLVTVLFADVANFTFISEKLDPEDVHEIMDGCFTILSKEIHEHEGTINQFTGDGVMALFGAPIAHEAHAQRACQAALAIQSSMIHYGFQIEHKFKFEFKMRIGLNSGPVIVGGIGDDLRMDYTAVGDTTNLANRMETMARPGGIWISENTQRLVKATLPAFQDLLSLKVEDDTWLHLDSQEKRERTLEALRNLLVGLSSKRPLVVAIDDLHWMDKTSEEFLTYFIDKLAHCPILLILLYRAEYTHPWGSKSYYTKIGLDQLTAASSAELIATILEGSEVGSDLKELIMNRAAGHPLFMEEFTHSLWEDGLIEKQDGRLVLSKKIKDIQVPDSIQGIIASRIDRLEENLKRTVQVASVVGRDFAFCILQAVSGMQAELKAHLLSLQGLEFIYEKQLLPELEYIFKHVLTQEVAYHSLLLKRRKELHERIGRAVEQLYAKRLEEYYELLAHHYFRSENSEKAFDYLKLSAEKAMRHNSAREALNYYEMAIAVLDRLPENKDQKIKKLEVIHLTISPLINLGFPDKSLSLLERGEKLAKDLADERRLFRFHTNIGFFYCTTGNYPVARTYIEQAFEAAENLHDISLMGQVIPDLYTVYLAAGEHMKSVDVMSDVIDHLEKSQKQKEFFGGPNNVYSILHSFCGLSLGWTGKFKNAITFCEKGNRAAAAVNDARTLGMGHYLMGIVQVYKGEFKPAKEHLESAIRYNEKLKHIPSSPGSYSWLGLACALAGDPATGYGYAAKGLKIQSETGYNYLASMGWFCLGACLAESGELEAARKNLEKGLEISRKNHERITEGALLIWLGRTLGQCLPLQEDRATECILLGIEISKELSQRPDEAIGYLLLAELHANRHRKDLARKYLSKSQALFEEMEMLYWAGRAQNILERLQH